MGSWFFETSVSRHRCRKGWVWNDMMYAGIVILHDVIGLFIPRTPCMAAVFPEYPFVDEVACAIK